MTGALAPPGPAPDLALPATIPTAWQCGPKPESGFFSSLGALGLQRQRLGSSVYVVRDTRTVTTGSTTTGFTSSVPGDLPIPADTTPAARFSDVQTNYGWGVRATAGYLFDNAALEVTGFYTPDNTSDSSVADTQRRLVLFFHNAPDFFAGTNDLFLHDDLVRTTLTTALGDVELNLRWWSRSELSAEGILGVRYLDVQDKLTIFADQQGVKTKDVNGNALQTLQATYLVRAHNHVVAPQVGFEWDLPLRSWMNLGLTAKGAWGVNYADLTTRLQRADGLVGAQSQRSDTAFTQVYELDAFVDFTVLERVRIRAGYDLLWALGVEESVHNITYDLSMQGGPTNRQGSILYHGPMIEVQFFF
jgi:hypothetical protein